MVAIAAAANRTRTQRTTPLGRTTKTEFGLQTAGYLIRTPTGIERHARRGPDRSTPETKRDTLFKRIAVVNRGEAAVRLIRAVKELNAEYDYGIRTVALHTEAERRAMFVRQADEAVTLAKPEVGSAYLDYGVLEAALVASGADAVWVGWGFVAEDPKFADIVARLNITFIGPSAAAMRLLGDKVEAKLLAEKVGVPVAPWSGGPVQTRADARRHAAAIGYPLIIKARSGGGGRGIRKVFAEDELELALERTQGEAERSFGDPVVFIERLVTDARHVEVQVIADNHGNVWAPGVRDCSIQRRNQKVIEESSSPLLTKEQADHLRSVSAELVRAAGYAGAGTVEYLYQPEQKIFTFLEVNTRLQVEHPITEFTTGIDLVKLQILVADGDALEGECPAEFGHAVEARLNAEDADNGFAPAPGSVELLKFPLGSGIRVDTGIAQGDVIPPDYDSMVAKVIAWGRDRSEAFARLRNALRETTVVIDGGTTTKSFLLSLLDKEEVISASADTGWLDRTDAGTPAGPTVYADVAIIAAAIDAYDAEEARERAAFLSSARGGRPRASHTVGRTVELSYQGQAYKLGVGQIGPHRYQVDGDSGDLQVDLERLGQYESRLTLGDRRFSVVTVAGAAHFLVEVDGISHQISQDEAGLVRAPAPAVVVAVPVAVGDEVEAGQTLVVLESMKMETAVRSPYAGTVREVLASVNGQVDSGAALLRVDQAGEQKASSQTARVQFRTVPSVEGESASCRALARLNELSALITGFDVGAPRARVLLADYERLRSAVPREDTAVLEAELALLNTFADICELSRNRPTMDEENTDERVHSPREHFHSFLHSLDSDIQGLPESFRSKLSRALRHYDADATEGRTPELEEAVYRVFLALQRIENQVPVIAALLDHWLTDTAAQPSSDIGEVLERLIVATQARYPVIGDVARNLRFHLFDAPQIRRARDQVYDGVRGSLQYLTENPDAPDYAARMQEVVDVEEPLMDLLGDDVDPHALLEAITRQYYGIHQFEDVHAFDRDDCRFVTGAFSLSGVDQHVIATRTDRSRLHSALSAIAGLAESTPGARVVDVYVSWPDAPVSDDELSAEICEIVAGQTHSGVWRRITLTVYGSGTARQLTLRPSTEGSEPLVEDVVIRDMHPLTGQRLDLGG